jgi:hypothetical protein
MKLYRLMMAAHLVGLAVSVLAYENGMAPAFCFGVVSASTAMLSFALALEAAE